MERKSISIFSAAPEKRQEQQDHECTERSHEANNNMNDIHAINSSSCMIELHAITVRGRVLVVQVVDGKPVIPLENLPPPGPTLPEPA